MYRTILSLCLTGIISVSAIAQDSTTPPPPPPCSAEEFSQFDFWIGEWALTWSDTMHASNSIRKLFNDCVIQEQFDGRPAINFSGMSVSTFNVNTKLWQQTWVDDQGSYLDFTGRWLGDKMVLSRKVTTPAGNTFQQRMVWHTITDSSFVWDWERLNDGDSLWTTNWQINYKREK